ncbi:MAG: selenide, water dikinase SelD [Betaproteobacteria bacterium RIFCSPLOWO2_02_FULL_62_17]|nr:MAG: selenide, water dikinase SelD [Betaproteobacteria bacterium RIFCSPLOWO2_02_FULL_62_17]
MNEMVTPFRLTSLAHGGGCGCKIAPGVLSEILKASPLRALPAALLSGSENNEDAAVYKLNDHQAIVATTDFFMPIVDDPFDFGRIAATNAISDVYAMGGQPLFALALLGMPISTLPLDVIQRISAGGESVCAEAGIPIAGGHSIDTVEPIYGLVVLGLVHPDKIKRNSGARAGDSLILGKPLGVGILSAALKQNKLSDEGYRRMLEVTTQLNKPGVELAEMAGVHALTDVTGFGLAGHLLELCRGAKLSAQIRWNDLPAIPQAIEHVKAGVFTGASTRNWTGYASEIRLAAGMEEWQKQLLTDPQTSGGLLVACAPQSEAAVLAVFARQGFADARRIGTFAEGAGLSVV